jgi:ADP-ribose pyrophosphatase
MVHHGMDYKYKITNRTKCYSGFMRMEKIQLRHQLFSGGWSPELKRECLERGHAVAVLPYDPQRDQVVLIEQFRIGAVESTRNPWLLEIVAGMIGPSESKLEVVRREAREEAGCQLLDVVPICEYLVSPGGSSETISLYCGRVDASQVSGIHGLAEEHEDIRVHVLPLEKALALLRNNGIVSATPIIALQWLALNRDALLARWSRTTS